MARKRKPGRPKTLAPDLTERFMLRCSKADLAGWTGQAQELGLTLSAWIRMRLKEKR